MDHTQQDNILLSLLTARGARGRDAKAFAHATAESQVALAQRPASRSVPVNTQEAGFLEVFPRVASRPPRLLQELESLLVDRLRTADKAACTTVLLPKDRDPRMAANLALDCHRQVLAAFVQGFSTYTSLLSRVQTEFEAALAEGVRCAAENVNVRVALVKEAERREVAEREAREKIMAEEYEFRRAAFAALQETRERTARLLKRAAAAEKDLQAARAEEARLKVRVGGLMTTATRLQAQQAADTAWEAAPISASVSPLQVGPLTREDEEFLEAEYTSTHPVAVPGSPVHSPHGRASAQHISQFLEGEGGPS